MCTRIRINHMLLDYAIMCLDILACGDHIEKL